MLRLNISLVDTTQAFANGILPKIEVGRILQVLAMEVVDHSKSAHVVQQKHDNLWQICTSFCVFNATTKCLALPITRTASEDLTYLYY